MELRAGEQRRELLDTTGKLNPVTPARSSLKVRTSSANTFPAARSTTIREPPPNLTVPCPPVHSRRLGTTGGTGFTDPPATPNPDPTAAEAGEAGEMLMRVPRAISSAVASAANRAEAVRMGCFLSGVWSRNDSTNAPFCAQ